MEQDVGGAGDPRCEVFSVSSSQSLTLTGGDEAGALQLAARAVQGRTAAVLRNQTRHAQASMLISPCLVLSCRNADSQLFDKVRGHDIKLLRYLSVRYICDLMVENKKVKFGLK